MGAKKFGNFEKIFSDPKSSLRPFLHRALIYFINVVFGMAGYFYESCSICLVSDLLSNIFKNLLLVMKRLRCLS